MKLLMSLLWADLKKRKVRFLLTLMAMAASASLIVWVIGTYDSLIESYDESAQNYMGNYQLALSPRGKQGTLPSSLPHELQKNAQVQHIAEAQWVKAYVVSEKKYHEDPLSHRAIMGIPSRGPVLVGLDSKTSPFELEKGRWWQDVAISEQDSSEWEGVIGSGAAKLLNIQEGDKVAVTVNAQVYFLRIVGIVPQSLSSPDIGRGKGGGVPLASLFTSPQVMEKIMGVPYRANVLFIQLHEGVDVMAYQKSLVNMLPHQGIDVTTVKTIEERLTLNRSTRAQGNQVNWALWMSLLAATFIIYTSLSIGIEERIRQFSLLRCLGMTRRQIAGLILNESLIFSLLGWLVGLLAGIILIFWVGGDSLVSAGLSLRTIIVSAACSFAGSLLAAIIPMWRATRLHPLANFSAPSVGKIYSARKKIVFCACLGIILFFPPAIIVFAPGWQDATRILYFPLVGSPCLVLGTLLLTPYIILQIERWAAPVLATLFRLPVELLRSQLSTHLTRTMGTAISLTLGLGLFVGIQTWGQSMLVPFMPSKAVPQTLLTFLPQGIPTSNIPELARHLNIDTKDILPCRNEQPLVNPAQLKSTAFHSLKNDNVVLMGMETALAFRANNPFFDLEWRSGNKEKGIALLQTERACLIPDSLHNSTGLDVGDTLQLQSLDNKTSYDYVIAGVVHIPGWHWLTKRSGVRRQGGFTNALVIADAAQVARDYPRDDIPSFWINIPLNKTEAELDVLAQKFALDYSARPAHVSPEHYQPYCLITALSTLTEGIQSRADSVIWAMCYLPIIAFVITLLAVGNTLVASTYARAWEFGVMRTLGLTRAQLMNLVLAEGVLIALVACVMSLFMGVSIAWGFVELSNYTLGFGAMKPPFILPWSFLVPACALTIALCIACAFFPAYFLRKREVITLLQQTEQTY